MKLSKQAIKLITGSGRVMNLLAVQFDCSESTIRRWINNNEPDSLLTTKSALKIIKEQTSLRESEILTQSIEA